MTAVRHIAPAARASIVALGAFERAVAVWSIDPIEQIHAFNTVLDFGGRRLALTPDGLSCIAGAYHAHGVACYASRTGEMRWSRRDPKKVQSIQPSLDGSGIYCFFDEGPGQYLDVTTGKTTAHLRAVRRIDQSPSSPVELVHRANLEIRRHEGELLFAIPRVTFAVLSVAFSPTSLAISESGGPVRFFDLSNHGQIGEYIPKVGHHVLRLAYCPSDALFYGVEWPYSRGGPKVLLRFDRAPNTATSVFSLGNAVETEFCHGGTSLLTSDGTLVHLGATISSRIVF